MELDYATEVNDKYKRLVLMVDQESNTWWEYEIFDS